MITGYRWERVILSVLSVRAFMCAGLRACSDARAPMCSSPPKKPLGEILASDQDAHKLATSERATEDLLSRLKECERRLKQCSDFAALVKSRADDPAAVHLGGQEQDRYGCVRLLVARPLLSGDPVALECRARVLQMRRHRRSHVLVAPRWH